MRFYSLVAAAALLSASFAAHADTVSSTAVAPFTIGSSADTLSFNPVNAIVAPGGSFTLTGTFTLGDSGFSIQVIPFTFQDVFTVNGITESLTFSGNDVVTLGPDTLNIFALGPVAFGGDTLSFGTFRGAGSAVGQVIPVSDTGTLVAGTLVAATPEPSSLALLGTGILGVIGVARKRFA